MCLAIPMQLLYIDTDGRGTVECDGSRQTIDLSMIEAPVPGDFLIVHAGFAIEKLDAVEADSRLQLFAELAQSQSAGAEP